jgi:predicted nucleotidyltransferase
MELEKIRNDIKQIGENISIKINGVEGYLFGSILTKQHNANDVDVLIIYKDEEQISMIKQEFKPLESIFPLHINYFTYEEETELNFVAEVKAEQIFKI